MSPRQAKACAREGDQVRLGLGWGEVSQAKGHG